MEQIKYSFSGKKINPFVNYIYLKSRKQEARSQEGEEYAGLMAGAALNRTD